MPIGTAVHERTFKLCESMNFREWSGYYAASVYEMHHEHEYNAIRNAAALIDVTPLFKYRITGKDATKFVNRVITRDINKVAVGQVIYCCWCDEQGKVIDDGTISRLEENVYRWTAADPSMRWFHQNALGLDVEIEDISEQACGAGTARANVGPSAEAGRGCGHHELEIFPRDARKNRGRGSGYFAHRLHGGFGIRDLDSMERRAEGVGCARRDGARNSICTRRECWHSMWRAWRRD